ncbi:MAG: HAMP domain-containing protein [Treponema sp.]|nr:HAMP domain-containing protein [Treponema sp.]
MENKTESAQGTRMKVLFPFRVKLGLIVTLILIGSIWITTTLVSVMVRAEFARSAEAANFDINSRAASGITDRLYGIRSGALMLLDMDEAQETGDQQARHARNIFFERNPAIAAIIVPGAHEIINRQFLGSNEISLDALNAWIADEAGSVERASKGDPVLKNISPVFGINLLAFFYPWHNTGFENAAIIVFSPENISEITGTGANSTFLVNGDGDILIHPDFSLVLGGDNISGYPIVESLWKSPGETVRLSYSIGGTRFVGAGQRIPFADAAIFSSLEYSLITEQITAVTRRNLLLSITVMFLTVLVTWFYGRSVTSPVQKLIAATGKIEAGDFKIDLKPESRDELGVLTERFMNMSRELDQWAAANSLVGRYNSQEFLDRTLAGEVEQRGEYLEAAILSVDYVSFPEILEIYDAAESLEYLNRFISMMTDSVVENGGVVDRILGSQLIAHWGIVSPGNIGGDVMNSLRAALTLRAAVWDSNTDMATKGKKNIFRMSCGIDTGKVLAGSIGTESFHKYSVTGKIVAEAIAAGDASVPSGTDIVITGAAREIAGSRILAEKLDLPHQRKTDTDLFALVNITPANSQDKQRWPFTLDDVRESLRGNRKAE